MKTWTVSQRIYAGFTLLLILTAVLGAFAVVQLRAIGHKVAELADNSLPSVLILNECAALSRDQIFTAQAFVQAETEEQRTTLERQIATNRASIDERFARYDALVSDAEDRRLFEATKRTRLAFATVRTRLRTGMTTLASTGKGCVLWNGRKGG